MSNKEELIRGTVTMPIVMAEKVDKKQKIILDRWSWVVLICSLILVLLKVIG